MIDNIFVLGNNHAFHKLNIFIIGCQTLSEFLVVEFAAEKLVTGCTVICAVVPIFCVQFWGCFCVHRLSDIIVNIDQTLGIVVSTARRINDFGNPRIAFGFIVACISIARNIRICLIGRFQNEPCGRTVFSCVSAVKTNTWICVRRFLSKHGGCSDSFIADSRRHLKGERCGFIFPVFIDNFLNGNITGMTVAV